MDLASCTADARKSHCCGGACGTRRLPDAHCNDHRNTTYKTRRDSTAHRMIRRDSPSSCESSRPFRTRCACRVLTYNVFTGKFFIDRSKFLGSAQLALTVLGLLCWVRVGRIECQIEAVRELDADIICLQEVSGGQPVKETFQ